MKSTFNKLEQYITEIDNRNKNTQFKNLIGVTIAKDFIPSVANVIGTDLSNYKIISKNQFACSLMQVSRDGGIAVALYSKDIPAIMSPAYHLFEVKSDKLLPEYLDMILKSKEFDRAAVFYAVGGVRGTLTWEEFCDMRIPVPSIQEQEKIVHDYKVVVDRIELLKKINDKLEEQAQLIYQSWFVNYIPFKRNRPNTWKEVTLFDISDEIVCGKTPSTNDENNFNGEYLFVTIPDMHNSVYVVKTQRTLSNEGITKILPKNSICVSCIATVGLVSLTAIPSQTNQQINSIICKNDISPFYVYLKMKTLKSELEALGAGGSATLNVSKNLFGKIKILYPDNETSKKFHILVEPLFESIRVNQLEIETLYELKKIMISNLTKEV